jgi:hypothetical protein
MTRRKTKQQRLRQKPKDPSRPRGAVAANHSQLTHNNTYGPLPQY